jgi:hypothetical protein
LNCDGWPGGEVMTGSDASSRRGCLTGRFTGILKAKGAVDAYREASAP